MPLHAADGEAAGRGRRARVPKAGVLTRPGWLEDFERAHGRPLRVLHIGNIANNAYVNAKVMRRIGIDADVICHDYYHVMGTPEWEDAGFTGSHGDDYFPDWWRVDLGTFERPRWFFQGPRDLCFKAIKARFSGNAQRSQIASDRLALATSLICHANSSLRDRGAPGYELGADLRRRRDLALYLGRFVLRKPTNPLAALSLIWSFLLNSRLMIVVGLARKARTEMRKLMARVRPDAGRKPAARRGLVRSLQARWRARRIAARQKNLGLLAKRPWALWIEGHLKWHLGVAAEELQKDLTYAHDMAHGWEQILKYYDVVQCYAVNAIIPMTLGRDDYLAYEHGTLRSIPFEPTPLGRLTATAYRHSLGAFVTNVDNLDKCRALKIDADRVIPLPHTLDDEKIRAFTLAFPHIRPAQDEPPELLSPTRQHWLDKDPSLAKGNDLFFDALVRVKAAGYRARVTLVAWGRDLEASKDYIRDRGIEDLVTWVEPMTIEELWKRYLGCHAIVDQFIVPAFGRVTFDALLLGRPVISNLDVGQATEFFGVPPPMLACATVDDIERALKRILDDPTDTQGLGAATAAWAARYHSTRRILDLQLAAYRKIVARHWRQEMGTDVAVRRAAARGTRRSA